jgi:phage tail-like protein
MSFSASASAGIGAPPIPAPPRPPAPPAPPGALAAAASARSKRTPTANEQLPDPAITIMFHLSVDFLSQGWWNSFEGLSMETVLESREEGGNNLWVHQLPTRLKFSNITLTRPLNEHSSQVARWFMDTMKKVNREMGATIQAVAVKPRGEPRIIAQWHLLGVVPVRWKGPSFNVDSPKLATETIELAFHGFGPDPAKGA